MKVGDWDQRRRRGDAKVGDENVEEQRDLRSFEERLEVAQRWTEFLAKKSRRQRKKPHLPRIIAREYEGMIFKGENMGRQLIMYMYLKLNLFGDNVILGLKLASKYLRLPRSRYDTKWARIWWLNSPWKINTKSTNSPTKYVFSPRKARRFSGKGSSWSRRKTGKDFSLISGLSFLCSQFTPLPALLRL